MSYPAITQASLASKQSSSKLLKQKSLVAANDQPKEDKNAVSIPLQQKEADKVVYLPWDDSQTEKPADNQTETALPPSGRRRRSRQAARTEPSSSVVVGKASSQETSGLPEIQASPRVPDNLHDDVQKRGGKSSYRQKAVGSIGFCRKEVGLENLGNTCFMNSSLQCLLHIQPLVSYFLVLFSEKEVNRSSPAKGMLAESFALLIKEMVGASNGSSLSPRNFQRAVARLAPHLLDYQQQDCQEFLRFLLDGMSEDLCRKSTVEHSSTRAEVSELNSVEMTTFVPESEVSSTSSLGTDKITSADKLRLITLKQREAAAAELASGRRSNKSSGGEPETTSILAAPLTAIANNFSQLRLGNSIGNGVSKSDDETSAVTSSKGSSASEMEAASLTSWMRYLKNNDSVITDIFVGQLQSTVECLTCHHKSISFDPFLDISVPIPEKKLAASSRRRTTREISWGMSSEVGSGKCTLQECLEGFSAQEVMEGDNMVTCDKCKAKRKCLKQLSIYRYPRVLIIHIKRFRYNSIVREKISTDVTIPLTGLDLSPYLCKDRPKAKSVDSAKFDVPPKVISSVHSNPLLPPTYDLVAVANHIGGLHGGHYIAHVNMNNIAGNGAADAAPTATPGFAERMTHDIITNLPSSFVPSGSAGKWVCFNDNRASNAAALQATGPSAYVLFYRIQGDVDLT